MEEDTAEVGMFVLTFSNGVGICGYFIMSIVINLFSHFEMLQMH